MENKYSSGEAKAQVEVMVVPFPAQGHLNQLLHLSCLLSSCLDLPVHFISSATHSRQAKLRIHGWDISTHSRIQFHEFETPHFQSPPPDPNASTMFPSHLLPSWEASSHLRELFAELLHSLSRSAKRVVVIYDNTMGTIVQDAASVPNAEVYMFIPVSAFHVFCHIWEKAEKPDNVGIDRAVLDAIPSFEGCFTREFWEFFAPREPSSLSLRPSGILYDTCKVIEEKYLNLIAKFQEGTSFDAKLWAIGPLNLVKMASSTRHECLEWLDKQEPNSVIYISFGTTTSLSDEQILEIAKGLEASGVKFIWVLREADRGDIFDGQIRRVELPKGYEERLKGKGIVERGWVPQSEILDHPSTGGFMSHCGWNSCMESVTMGVPMAAWPMHSDQPTNSTLITKVLKVGILVRDWEARYQLVNSATIEQVIKKLMGSDEGKEMRLRMVEFGGAVRRSIAEGGVTRLELDSFYTHITR